MLLGDFSSSRIHKSGIAALFWCSAGPACFPQPLLDLNRKMGLCLRDLRAWLQAPDDIEPFELGAMQEAG